jgi:hypothetical protein
LGSIYQELKGLTQLRLSRESAAKNANLLNGSISVPFASEVIVNMGDSEFKLPSAQALSSDTEIMSEKSSRSSQSNFDKNRSKYAVVHAMQDLSGADLVGSADKIYMKPILPVPVASLQKSQRSDASYVDPVRLDASQCRFKSNKVSDSLAATTTADSVPIDVLDNTVASSLRSMKFRPTAAVLCPDIVVCGTVDDISSIDPRKESPRPLQKYGPMGFRKSLLKFLDSDSDLSDLDLSRHSLDFSGNGRSQTGRSQNGRSNNGRSSRNSDCNNHSMDKSGIKISKNSFPSNDVFLTLSTERVDLDDRPTKFSHPYASFTAAPYMSPHEVIFTLKKQSSDADDPLDCCRHGDLKK